MCLSVIRVHTCRSELLFLVVSQLSENIEVPGSLDKRKVQICRHFKNSVVVASFISFQVFEQLKIQ